MAKDKIFTVQCAKSGTFTSKTSYYYQTGTLMELIKAHSYTLEVGKSWEHEKGNKKINMNPKSVLQLVKMLNYAVDNAAANGYSGKTYSIVNKEQVKQ